jgi:hypothetical protein
MQRLIFRGMQIENPRKLSDYSMEDESKIFLVVRLANNSDSDKNDDV